MNKEDYHIDYVINNFDFERVYRVMVALNWGWYPIGRVPTVGEMRELAEELLHTAFKEKCTIATGGFEATYDEENKGFNLCFTVESVDVYEDE